MRERVAHERLRVHAAEPLRDVAIADRGIDPDGEGAHPRESRADDGGLVARGRHEDDAGQFGNAHLAQPHGNRLGVCRQLGVAVALVAARAVALPAVQVDDRDALRVLARYPQHDIGEVEDVAGERFHLRPASPPRPVGTHR